MDLSLWDSSDDLASFAYKSGYNSEDHLLCDFSFCCGRDMLEEDALNEKSCMQVLKIWIDKADEDIVKLQEDILMLQCQLVWDDEKWSTQCSAALREKIDHLDILIQRLKDSKEHGLRSETEDLAPRLHDLLKPLLENYLAKSDEHTETSSVQIPVPPAVELGNKKIEENECATVLKTYERKSKSMELEERKICLPQQKKDAVIRNFDASCDTCTNDEASESTLERRRIPNLVHVKLEPAAPMVKESSASTNSRENEEKRENANKAISEAKDVHGRIRHEIKVDSVKSRTEASSKVRKAGVVYRRALYEDVLSMKPSVKTKGTNSRILQTQEAVKDLAAVRKNPPYSLNDRTEQVKKPRMESEHQIQVQQILQNSVLEEHRDKGTSPIENLRGQKRDGVLEGMSKNDIASASKVTATPTLLAQEVRKSSLSSQTTSKKGDPKNSLMKLAKMERDASNSTVEDTTDGANNVHQIPSPCIKNKERLTLCDLRAIAKSQKLRGYYRLRREQLQILLGLE